MKITSLHVEGFRSLANVRLEGLGPFVVLYGPNGAGKSNLLDFLAGSLSASRGRDAFNNDDLPSGYEGLQGTLRLEGAMPDESWPPKLSVVLEEGWPCYPHLGQPVSGGKTVAFGAKLALEFSSINATRRPVAERRGEMVNSSVPALLEQGKLVAALFAARNSPSFEMRSRYKKLQQILRGEPLKRPPFVPVEYPDGRIELREELPDGSGDIPLNLAGLGVFQLYAILAQIVLSGARIIALEEPEAHLHAPTSGRHLRTLLKRCVDEGLVDQFFIATHSNLFDLDPEGYWDVSLDSQGHTQVERRPLTDIDARHLYEPGPAKHALLRLLEYIDPESVVFRDAEGSGISAKRMVQMLQSDDKLALDFLRDVNGAAVQSVRARARRQPVS